MRNHNFWPVSLALFVITACAGPGPEQIETPPLQIAATSNEQGTAATDFTLEDIGISAENARKWQEFTSFPSVTFEHLFGPYCGMTVGQPPAPSGTWQLIGVSTSSLYTPILDIVAQRNNEPPQNETLYYHFRLYGGEKSH